MTKVDSKAFRDVMSCFASGVTVVTTMCEGVPHGLTVSAFSSVSLSPPRVLICLGNDTDSKPLIDRSGCFAVHILGRKHLELGPRFAKLVPDQGDPFGDLQYRLESTGSPVLAECIAWLDCRVETAVPIGDHTLYIGDVQSAGKSVEEGDPVLYYQRAWRVLDPESVG